ncbi:MAG TPA: alpha/beta hydrolase [Dehalococcoidia bacterium]|nr:alpha/beta hydrolase [Dehalococcoidia bacterium]
MKRDASGQRRPSIHVSSFVRGDSRPPIVLVHGAGNSSLVWLPWLREMGERGWDLHAIDLRGHGASEPVELSEVSMGDYVADVAGVVEGLKRPPILFGWSMGGLIAQMYGSTRPTLPAMVLFAPSPPLGVQGEGNRKDAAGIAEIFGPEEYGVDINDRSGGPAMFDLTEFEVASVRPGLGFESGLARRERKIGIDVLPLAMPVLVVHGGRDESHPPAEARAVASYHHGTALEHAEAGHWGVVASREIVKELAPRVNEWLAVSLKAER